MGKEGREGMEVGQEGREEVREVEMGGGSTEQGRVWVGRGRVKRYSAL